MTAMHALPRNKKCKYFFKSLSTYLPHRNPAAYEQLSEQRWAPQEQPKGIHSKISVAISEWVEVERPPPKITPKPGDMGQWKYKGLLKYVKERSFGNIHCPDCKNLVHVMEQIRATSGHYFKYTQKSASGAEEVLMLRCSKDSNLWQARGCGGELLSGDDYDTYHEKYLASIICARCGECVSHEYLGVYLQEGLKNDGAYISFLCHGSKEGL